MGDYVEQPGADERRCDQKKRRHESAESINVSRVSRSIASHNSGHQANV